MSRRKGNFRRALEVRRCLRCNAQLPTDAPLLCGRCRAIQDRRASHSLAIPNGQEMADANAEDS